MYANGTKWIDLGWWIQLHIMLPSPIFFTMTRSDTSENYGKQSFLALDILSHHQQLFPNHIMSLFLFLALVSKLIVLPFSLRQISNYCIKNLLLCTKLFLGCILFRISIILQFSIVCMILFSHMAQIVLF